MPRPRKREAPALESCQVLRRCLSRMYITLCCKGQDSRAVRIERHTPLKPMLSEHCRERGLCLESFDVVWHGICIDPESSPIKLGLLSGSTLALIERDFAQVRVTTSELFAVPVYEHPSTMARIIGYLHEGDIVQASAVWSTWLRIKKWWPKGGWLRHPSEKLTEFTLLPTSGQEDFRIPLLVSNPWSEISDEKWETTTVDLLDNDATKSSTPTESPLSLAACFNLSHKVRTLLDDGNDPSEPSGPLSRTPLINCAIHGSIDVAKLLLEARADVSGTDSFGRCALRYASGRGRTAIVRLLLAHKAHWAGRDEQTLVALREAMYSKNVDVVDVLLPHVKTMHEQEAAQVYIGCLSESLDWFPSALLQLVWDYWAYDCKQAGWKIQECKAGDDAASQTAEDRDADETTLAARMSA
mmetsp:Transcript_15965/g.30200  ORF Transcript_15965/g.30200 Transcript_15965/m.30200 type:complete len:413 (-) Transcript_15965:248-1486(-)